jgi:hypothetical protein
MPALREEEEEEGASGAAEKYRASSRALLVRRRGSAVKDGAASECRREAEAEAGAAGLVREPVEEGRGALAGRGREG